MTLNVAGKAKNKKRKGLDVNGVDHNEKAFKPCSECVVGEASLPEALNIFSCVNCDRCLLLQYAPWATVMYIQIRLW